MDYFQSAVYEYLQRDRSCFVNTEYLLVHKSKSTEEGPPEWLVDIVAIDFRTPCIWLCEISYSRHVTTLVDRVRQWEKEWDKVCATVRKEACLPEVMQVWPIRVRAFVPAREKPDLEKRDLRPGGLKLEICELEKVVPWEYNRWERIFKAPDSNNSQNS
jgi:hypothetical protein